MRSKLPKGPGVWPAFWLLGVPKLQDQSVVQIEIDLLEQYGAHPNALRTTVHLWGRAISTRLTENNSSSLA